MSILNSQSELNSFLISLRVSQWTARKMDRAATKDAKERAGAGAKAGVKVYKSIIAAQELEAIDKIVSAARSEHEKRTTPWAYRGPGAITSAGYAGYKDAMAALEKDFDKAVVRFLDVYDSERVKAQSYLGAMFNPQDYPTAGELRGKFAFAVHVEPFPNAQAFQPQGLPPAQVEEIRRDIIEANRVAINNANATAWGRVVEAVNMMETRLREYSNGEVTKFYDSWVGNVKELADLIPSINIANDPALKAVGMKLRMLGAYRPDSLKNDPALRNQVVSEAKALLAQISASAQAAA
jgi:hypothetical protein